MVPLFLSSHQSLEIPSLTNKIHQLLTDKEELFPRMTNDKHKLVLQLPTDQRQKNTL